MATLVQLQSELWWGVEYQPPALVELCAKLRDQYNVSAVALGSKGDANHLYGYHRSAAWVRNSRFCTNRTYSVSETAGNRNPGDPNWLCAVDATLPLPELLAACQRLDAAVRSGRLEKVVEWYGNSDGDQRVDGYDNIRNIIASSDDSHLWHLHLSFDRGLAGENHDDVFAILTGTETPAPPSRKATGMFRLIDTEDGQFVISPDTLSPTGWSYVQITPDRQGWVLVAAGVGTANGSAKDPNADPHSRGGGDKDWRPGMFGPSKAEVRKRLVDDVIAGVLAKLPTGPTGSGPSLDQIRTVVDQELDEQSLGGADKD